METVGLFGRSWSWLTFVETNDPFRKRANQALAVIIPLFVVLTTVDIVIEAYLGHPDVPSLALSLPLQVLAWWINRRGSSLGGLIYGVTGVLFIVTGFSAADLVAIPVALAIPVVLAAVFTSPLAGVACAIVELVASGWVVGASGLPASDVTKFWLYAPEDVGALALLIAYGAWLLRRSLQESSEANARLASLNADLDKLVQERTWELARARDDAMRKERHAMIGSLTAGVAHEINNPLAFMAIETEMFLSQVSMVPADELPPGFQESAEKFGRTNKQGVDRIAKIVRSLRTLSKPDEGMRALPIRPIVEATVTLAHASLRTKQVTLDIDNDVTAFAVGDHVGQIALNLIINAADASPATHGKIRVEASTSGGTTTLRVVDNGHGIPADVRPRIFTQFFTTKQNGTGLGLAICKRLAEQDGGALRFEDVPGGGTAFILELPAAAPVAAQVAPSPAPAPRPGAA